MCALHYGCPLWPPTGPHSASTGGHAGATHPRPTKVVSLWASDCCVHCKAGMQGSQLYIRVVAEQGSFNLRLWRYVPLT
jgi:hypothetical protein